jgi:hypothetical protein
MRGSTIIDGSGLRKIEGKQLVGLGMEDRFVGSGIGIKTNEEALIC